MAKLTMFLICMALIVTAKALPGLSDDFDDKKSDDWGKDFDNFPSSFKSLDDDITKDMTPKGSDWMDMDMSTMPALSFDDVENSHKKCKTGDKNCVTYSNMKTSSHVSHVVNGVVVENETDSKEVTNDNGKITKTEKHQN